MSIIERLRRVLCRLRPTGDLSDRVIKSTLWVLSQNSVGRAIQLLMLLVLARLIGPGEIGLVGIALLTLSGLRGFTNIGLNAALVQQRADDVDDYLDTTWLLEIGRGLVIATVMIAVAPLIASVFGAPRAERLIQVMALSPIIRGVRNPGVVYFQKHLEFDKQFLYRVSGNVVQFLVAVGYALVSPTAWAFAAGFVVADTFRLCISYLIHDYRPRPQFDREAARELVDYGKWITGSSILYFIYSEGDDAFVGWFLSPVMLGLYQYGYRFSNAPATELSDVVTSVAFPAYAKLQDDTAALRSGFLHTVRLVGLVSFPMAFGIAVTAPQFVRGFLGSDWVGMITVMQILALYGLLRAVGKTFGAVWKAIDRPDITTKLSALRVVLVAVTIYPATAAWGIEGTALAVTGVYVFPMMPLDIHIVVQSVESTYTELLSELVYPLVASGVMAGSLWSVSSVLSLPPIQEFVLLVVLGIVVYGVAVVVLERRFDWGIGDNLQTIVTSLRA